MRQSDELDNADGAWKVSGNDELENGTVEDGIDPRASKFHGRKDVEINCLGHRYQVLFFDQAVARVGRHGVEPVDTTETEQLRQLKGTS